MSTRLALSLVLLLLASTATGQGLVRNGDFEADLTNWSGSGPGGSPGITSFDVTGLGASKCFNLRPGGNTYAPPHAPYILQQTVLSVPTWMELRMDVCLVAANSNAQGGTIDVKVGGQLAGTWQRFVGSISPGTYRDQLCFRFRPTAVGNQPLDIEMGRPRFVWSASTPVLYIDNVSMRLVSDPVICMPGERKAGTPVNLEIRGGASAACAVFVAPKAAAAPFPIPGWSGSLGLDPATLTFLFAAALDGNGAFKASFTPPAGLAGIPLFWQGAQFAATGNTLGLTAAINFY